MLTSPQTSSSKAQLWFPLLFFTARGQTVPDPTELF